MIPANMQSGPPMIPFGQIAPKANTNVKPAVARAIYYQMSTNNKSFLDMHEYLKAIGIKNNKFMLTLLDPDLAYIDPHDPSLNVIYKQKVLRECICNYWYWLRECVRLPSEGGSPVKFELSRGNLAYNFCAMLNLNTYYIMPRQCGKTISVLCRYLYVYTCGTTNSKMAFLNKSAEASRENLSSLKALQELLPSYLQFKERPLGNGKTDKGKYNTTQIINPFNNNSIKSFASGTTQSKAASILRGKTLPLIYFDEYAFLAFNSVTYMNSAPAFRTAAMNAKKSGAPYGITITTTPGFMTTEEGKAAYSMKEQATPFSEGFYDLTLPQLMNIVESNKRSNYIYIEYSYQQLGKSEKWFEDLCLLMSNSWPDIRREILLQWNAGVVNSPFSPDDLEAIRTMVRPPISVVYLLGKYRFETYLQADTSIYPPIIGVDVAAGYKQDSSTITVIDSKTTKVLGCMNCNYISSIDLAKCIEFIVKNWLPSAVICVERNGGFGASVIANLIKAGLRKNLYYEIKDVQTEERFDGIHAYRQKVRTKVYGLNSTREVRKQLIDLLADRVQFHKDKFLSPIIYNELLGMEIKRNGKVEHSDSTHDDQIFSYLMALWVMYNGTNIGERYGIQKTVIRTDDDVVDDIETFEPETMSIVEHFNSNTEIDDITEKTIDQLNNPKAIQLKEYIDQQSQEELEHFYNLMNTRLGERAYKTKYNIPDDQPISKFIPGLKQGDQSRIPDSVFLNFYNQDIDNTDIDTTLPSYRSVVPAGMEGMLETDGYRLSDHFNF